MAGDTWSPTSLTYEVSQGHGFHFVEAGPGASGRFLAGATDGLWLSTDNGVTWVLKLSGGNFYHGKWKPGLTNIVYACKGNGGPVFGGDNGVWRSTNNGDSWTSPIGTGQPDNPYLIGKSKLATCPSEPARVYVAFADSGQGRTGNVADLYISTNNGLNWDDQNIGIEGIGGQTNYNLVLTANPTNSAILLAAAVNLSRSTNSGASFSLVLGDGLWFKDNHSAVYEPPNSGSNVWMANDAGMFRSTNDGLAWGSKNVGLATFQLWDIATNPGPTPNWALGGVQDNQTYRWPGGVPTWDYANPTAGDGTGCAIDGSNGTVAYAQNQTGSLLWRTTDSGISWVLKPAGFGGKYINPIAVDPSDGTVYRSASTGIQKSTDQGNTWVVVDTISSGDLPKRTTWIGISRANGNHVWAVSQERIRFTTNDGGNWSTASPYGFATGVPTKILAHPTNTNTVLVTFSGYSSSVAHVALTTDSGGSWSDVTDNLPGVPVNAIAINPSNISQWFVGTDIGVYLSTNSGEPWITYDGTGPGLLPNTLVTELEVQNNMQRLIAGTFGRATWETDIFAAGANVTWSGTVHLDSDVLIPQGAKLTIQPGTQIIVAASDRKNIGVDPDRIEIICQGTILALGGTGPGQSITFTCAVTGSWYGLRMDLEGCQYTHPDSTWMASAFETPRLENVTIEKSQYGVKIENFIAPSLVNVTFTSITNNREIYLDRTDVFIPRGHWTGTMAPCTSGWTPTAVGEWRLLPGTDIVATNSSIQDATFGGFPLDPEKVNLIPHGRLITLGTSASRVRFRPETENNGTATDWGGIYVDWPARGTWIDFAEVSHASIPVTFFYSDSVTIRRSSIHHFAQTGIKVVQASGKGATIDSCQVVRGSGLSVLLGSTCIVLEKSAPMIVKADSLDLSGYLNEDIPGAGIHILNTRSYCDQASLAADSVQIVDNWIIGPGSGAQFNNCKGLKMEWSCGAGPRLVFAARNLVKNWNDVGIFMYQNSDVQLNCNTLASNRTNLDFTRTSTVNPSEPGARLRFNTFEPPIAFGLRTDDALKLELGPNSLDRGTNHIKTIGTVKFIIENDPCCATPPADTLNVVHSKWFVDGQPESDPPDIALRFGTDITDPIRVKIEPVTTNSTACSGVPGGDGYLSLEEVMIDDARVAASPTLVASGQFPPEAYLWKPSPLPSSGITEISFGVGIGEAQPASLMIYSVDGRVVRSLLKGVLAPGNYRESWDGKNEAGQSVAVGVYLLHLEVGTFRKTEKLVRIK